MTGTRQLVVVEPVLKGGPHGREEKYLLIEGSVTADRMGHGGECAPLCMVPPLRHLGAGL